MQSAKTSGLQSRPDYVEHCDRAIFKSLPLPHRCRFRLMHHANTTILPSRPITRCILPQPIEGVFLRLIPSALCGITACSLHLAHEEEEEEKEAKGAANPPSDSRRWRVNCSRERIHPEVWVGLILPRNQSVFISCLFVDRMSHNLD